MLKYVKHYDTLTHELDTNRTLIIAIFDSF